NSEAPIEDAATRFALGSYLLEVKATTTGRARLTPLQVETACNDSRPFVLCVVNLQNLTSEELDAEWTAERVLPLAKMVTGIAGEVEGPFSHVHKASTS